MFATPCLAVPTFLRSCVGQRRTFGRPLSRRLGIVSQFHSASTRFPLPQAMPTRYSRCGWVKSALSTWQLSNSCPVCCSKSMENFLRQRKRFELKFRHNHLGHFFNVHINLASCCSKLTKFTISTSIPRLPLALPQRQGKSVWTCAVGAEEGSVM